MGPTTARGSPVSISVLRPERQHLQRDEELGSCLVGKGSVCTCSLVLLNQHIHQY